MEQEIMELFSAALTARPQRVVPVERVKALPETPETPKPETPETPKPETPETPEPETPESPEPETPPEPTPGEQTRAAVLDYALTRAAADSGSHDPELVRYLLGLEAYPDMEPEALTAAVTAALRALRRSRPYLFRDGGQRPRFASPVRARELSHDEEIVARRYQNNPWYRRK